jgi:hypothetical protein
MFIPFNGRKKTRRSGLLWVKRLNKYFYQPSNEGENPRQIQKPERGIKEAVAFHRGNQ